MKKLACVGFHATGAGVIDDLFREFDNVSQGVYEAECHLLQAADGISDLEFHLVECPNRMKTGIAIERFLRYVNDTRRMHEKIFGSSWLPLCNEYVNSITKFQFLGYHDRQIEIRKPILKYVHLFNLVLNRLRPISVRRPGWYNYYPNATEYHACLDEQSFLNITQDFVDKLCDNIAGGQQAEYVMLDQFVDGSNPARYMRYVKDLKVIVVDRDPRDLYIHHVLHKDHKLPKDPQQFCIHYRDIRKKKGEVTSGDVFYTSFEEMIYRYEEMVPKILEFVGISPNHHVNPKSHFNPSVSIKGTRQWERHPEFAEAVTLIEKELPEYLFQY